MSVTIWIEYVRTDILTKVNFMKPSAQYVSETRDNLKKTITAESEIYGDIHTWWW